MITFTACQRRLGVTAVLIMASLTVATSAPAGGAGGTNSFGGARIGGVGGYSGANSGLSRGSSIINHGGTGFSIYSQSGVTRVIGQPKVSKKILLPDGSSTHVIADGTGGAYVFGIRGNHRILDNRRLFADDGH
jgi:hypothetical protein